MSSAANDQVTSVLQGLVETGQDVGVQVAAYLNGELVIDTWAGVADPETGRAVDGDSMFTVFSTSKGPASTCIHQLVERGKLFYDEPIAKYWPEFAAKGKAAVTLRHALTHRSGVPNNPPSLPERIDDWDLMCREIAGMEPLYEPGTRTGYHGLTFGWILGEVLRRVDGRPIAQYLQEEVCGPLGLKSLYFGIPASEEHRVAPLIIDPSMMQAAFNRSEVRQASIPAGGGIMSARDIARHYAALANGGELDGARILSEERIRIATTLQTEMMDDVFKFQARKALGYWLGGPGLVAGGLAGPNTFGFQGFGGSVGFADPERRFAFGLTRNNLMRGPGGPSTAEVIEQAVEKALGLS
jgi:CubicO group peptidase (beta-lactamase class C family)